MWQEHAVDHCISWAGYDDRVAALLGMGGAGVVESLLRTTARMPALNRHRAVMMTKVHHFVGT